MHRSSLLHWPSFGSPFALSSPSPDQLHPPVPVRPPSALPLHSRLNLPPSTTPATTLLPFARAESSFRTSPCCLEPRFPVRPLSKSPSLRRVSPALELSFTSSRASHLASQTFSGQPRARSHSPPSSHPYFPVEQHQRQRHCACPLATAHSDGTVAVDSRSPFTPINRHHSTHHPKAESR